MGKGWSRRSKLWVVWKCHTLVDGHPLVCSDGHAIMVGFHLIERVSSVVFNAIRHRRPRQHIAPVADSPDALRCHD